MLQPPGGSRFRQHTSRDKQWRTLRAFMGAFSAAIGRRHLWNVLPWDPASAFVLYGEHAATYRQLLAYYRRSLVRAHMYVSCVFVYVFSSASSLYMMAVQG